MGQKELLKRLRDEIYDCYIRSCDCIITFNAVIKIGYSLKLDRYGGYYYGPWLRGAMAQEEESLLREHLRDYWWRGLANEDCRHPIYFTGFQDADLDQTPGDSKSGGTGRKRTRRNTTKTRTPRGELCEQSIGFCFSSDREPCHEVTRYVQQSNAVLDLAWQRSLGIWGGRRSMALIDPAFEWPLLCMILAWERPDLVTYKCKAGLYVPEGPEDGEDVPDGPEDGEEAYRMPPGHRKHPLSDRFAFEAWRDGTLRPSRGNYYSYLSRDIRICTVSAIDAVLVMGETPAKPVWDRVSRELRFGGSVCRKYLKTAPNQFEILDAFQRADWPDTVPDPWRRPETLSQTIKDLNEGMDPNSPIVFGVENTCARWSRSSSALRPNPSSPDLPASPPSSPGSS
jgi:hypothetical protein